MCPPVAPKPAPAAAWPSLPGSRCSFGRMRSVGAIVQERQSMDLQLSIAMANNPRTRAIFEDKVKADGISLICTPLHASELFWRQLRFGDFDVSEMSMSSFLMALAGGRSEERRVGKG